MGELITEALLADRIIVSSGERYEVTDDGHAWFAVLGVDVAALKVGRRFLARPCLDWSERHYHLARALGAAFTHRLLELQ